MIVVSTVVRLPDLDLCACQRFAVEPQYAPAQIKWLAACHAASAWALCCTTLLWVYDGISTSPLHSTTLVYV